MQLTKSNLKESGRVLVFAYGSNLCLTRLLDRVPSARFKAKGWVDGYQLRLHKIGQDGSAKANCFYTGKNADRVYGVIYTLDKAEKKDLDRHEGLGKGYDVKVLPVKTETGDRIPATAYIAAPYALNNNLLPYDWYLQYIVTGVKDFNFPSAYLEKIKSFPSIPDQNTARIGIFEDTLRRHENLSRKAV